MAFRNIVVQNPANISLKNSQLIIRTDTEHSVAIEDISALLIESRQTNISTAALSKLGECGCAVFFCNEKHLPCAVMTPFATHSRELSVLKSQLDAGEVLKKHLWQSVVVSKISNQARCLQMCGQEKTAEGLRNMAADVRSGDSGNVEATAALRYFPALFGKGFIRGRDDGINSALNYGYAIIRGAMARFLATYGFTSALGLHHRSELNNFNLADDLMEPFRPVIDLLVYINFQSEDELTPESKHLLFNSLNLDILSGGQHHSVNYAIERLVQSYGRALEQEEAKLLLPELIELKQHSYE
jgi:CRISPR-associated protein Cas1